MAGGLGWLDYNQQITSIKLSVVGYTALGIKEQACLEQNNKPDQKKRAWAQQSINQPLLGVPGGSVGGGGLSLLGFSGPS